MTSIRESLVAARAELESAPEAAPEVEVPEVVDTAPADVAAESTSATEAPADNSIAAAMARARDEKGRFATKSGGPERVEASATTKPAAPSKPTATPAPVAADTDKAAPPKAEAPAPTGEAFKAPQSWTPAAREALAKAHPAIQAEALRVDREVQRVFRESEAARKFADGFRETVAPYSAMLRAEGADPLNAVGGLLQTAALFRTGTPQQKAQAVAEIMRNFGIAGNDVADAWERPQAAQPAARPQPQQQHVDPNTIVAQVREQLRSEMQVEQFKAAAPHFDVVRGRMAAIFEASERAGEPLTLQEAYDAACHATPSVRAAMAEEAAKAQAAAKPATPAPNPAAIQRAKAAASSVRSHPASAGPSEPGADIRSHMMAALARTRGR